jgi:cell division protein FtsW (lipid II flippase)
VAKRAAEKLPRRERNSVTQASQSRRTELVLLALALVITTAFYILASLGAQGQMPSRLWLFLVCMIGISLGMHLAIRHYAPRSSQILLPVATLLNGIGYVEIARWNSTRAAYQAAWFLFSAIGVVLVLKFVKHIRDLDRYRYLTLVAAVFLLLMPLIPHIGVSSGGARLWVALGPISFQPVEIAKVLLVFFFASYFGANRELLSTPTQRFLGRTVVPPRVLLPILVAWGFSIAVLGAENDIGFAMLLFALFISLLWLTTGLKSYVFLGIGLFGVGAVFAAKVFTQIHQRVSQWLDPWSAVNFAFSHQLAYGWFSLAAGGITGTGLGLGQSGNIPEITSDMIFAAIGEELGFLGIVLVLCLFAVFVGESFRIAQRATSDYVRIATAGLGAIIGFQAFFIMAGVLRILPFTGITLPFMAYGGSSLFSNYVIVALLLVISNETASEKRGGEIVALEFL